MITTNFLDWLTVYEHEKQMKKIVMVPKKQKSKKCSRSKVLEKIADSLEQEQYRHMLYWVDKTKKEFIIKFVHMNNPEWKNADYLELFRELDKLSKQYKKYSQEKKYDHKCKIRCKANLRKLVESGALTFMGKTFKGKSILLRKYKLNFDVSSAKDAVSKDVKMTKRCSVNGFSGGCETVQGIAYIKGKLKIENLPNEQSPCLCLSKNNSINIYVNIPVVGTSISSVSPIRLPSLDICCTEEKRNEDNLPQQPLTVYEHEKDKNDDVLHAMSTNDPGLYSSSSYSSIVENNNCKSTGYCKLLDEKTQDVEIQNNCRENVSMESERKFVFPNRRNIIVPVEEAMGATNLASTLDIFSGYNELQYLNKPKELQNEGFQDMDDETKNYAQLVPSSPQNFEGIMNDPLPQWYGDYRPDVSKPLQQDNDPLWFESFSGCLNDNLPEENLYLIANNEGSFSFNDGV